MFMVFAILPFLAVVAIVDAHAGFSKRLAGMFGQNEFTMLFVLLLSAFVLIAAWVAVNFDAMQLKSIMDDMGEKLSIDGMDFLILLCMINGTLIPISGAKVIITLLKQKKSNLGPALAAAWLGNIGTIYWMSVQSRRAQPQ